MRALSDRLILEHVQTLGHEHPPIPLESVDYSVKDPVGMSRRFGRVLDFLARVELEVERNVLELLVLLPGVGEADRMFYADVWADQEIRHGVILDKLQNDIGRPPAEPDTTVSTGVRILGMLAHFPAIHDIIRLLYYLTGAATERQAVLAYNRLEAGLIEMDEQAIARTVIGQIKRQEPGHYAFYNMSATLMFQQGELRPWQVFLARQLRKLSFEPVGMYGDRTRQAEFGGVAIALGLDEDLARIARDVGRVEHSLLWASKNGMEVPPYILKAFEESVAAFRSGRSFAA
ncbi:hypothetical protein [Propionicicella superfundia]|uniref:hypothetical protein n=1 Tax=Propionicicella superfundia TaxID=348582 RepID=UPI0003F4E649|nr:hypothetical protein [Propionicicella superfundia]